MHLREHGECVVVDGDRLFEQVLLEQVAALEEELEIRRFSRSLTNALIAFVRASFSKCTPFVWFLSPPSRFFQAITG